MSGRSRVFANHLLAALLALPGAALAQEFPSKPLRLVMPVSAGNGTDAGMRVAATKLTERLGWNILVENRPGGLYTPAVLAVVRSPADGYSILYGISSLAALPVSTKDLPYDLLKDMQPVMTLGITPAVVFVNASVPVNTWQELVAYTKANPGKLSFGTTSPGSFNHLSGELIRLASGFNAHMVPYNSTNYQTDLLSGRLQFAIAGVGTYGKQAEEGKVRPVLILGSMRAPSMPNVPTAAELMGPETAADAWGGLLMRAGSPKAAVDRIEREFTALLQLPDIREKFLGLGIIPLSEGPEQFKRRIETDMRRWEKVVRDANIKFD